MENSIIFRNTLVSDIFRYTGFVSEFAHRVHKVTVCPKFTTPQLLLHPRMLLENFSGCQTFHCRDNLSRTLLWYTLHQKMDMVFVNPYFQKSNLVSFRYFKTDVFQTLINGFVEHYSTIFRWANKMIQQYRYVMRLVNVFAFAHSIKINFSPQAAGN